MESYHSQIRKSVIITVAIIIFVSCSTNEQAINNMHSSSSVKADYYFYAANGYSLSLPNDFADQKEISGIKYFGYAKTSKTGDILIKIHNESKKCSPSITGASKMINIEDSQGQTNWGRVDVWDDIEEEGWEWPENWQQIICKKEGTPKPAETYALCSEKDGKAVVICMDQFSDNPKLAEEIFSTFKWLDK